MHAEGTLDQVALWLRGFHDAIADFTAPDGSIWRGGKSGPGLEVGHNDAAPYNAAWRDGRLAGFFDWDFAGPAEPGSDLAFTAFSWVPLHARHVVAREGFADLPGRPRRFLDAYGWSGDPVFIRLLHPATDDLARAIEELPTLG